MNEPLEQESSRDINETSEINVTPSLVTEDSTVQDDEYTANYIHERFYWLKVARPVSLAIFIGLVELVLLVTVESIRSSAILSVLAVLGMVLTLWFAVRSIWIWKHWVYEIDPSNNLFTLHMPGYKRLFVPERGSPAISLQGTFVTKYEQTWYEQWIFKNSFTVTIDNDIQSDEVFHDVRFMKDGKRIRNICVWYNNIVQRREKEEGDVNRKLLTEVRATNDRLDTLIVLIGDLTNLLSSR